MFWKVFKSSNNNFNLVFSLSDEYLLKDESYEGRLGIKIMNNDREIVYFDSSDLAWNRQLEESLIQSYCPKCKATFPEDSSFCGECGTYLEKRKKEIFSKDGFRIERKSPFYINKELSEEIFNVLNLYVEGLNDLIEQQMLGGIRGVLLKLKVGNEPLIILIGKENVRGLNESIIMIGRDEIKVFLEDIKKKSILYRNNLMRCKTLFKIIKEKHIII